MKVRILRNDSCYDEPELAGKIVPAKPDRSGGVHIYGRTLNKVLGRKGFVSNFWYFFSKIRREFEVIEK